MAAGEMAAGDGQGADASQAGVPEDVPAAGSDLDAGTPPGDTPEPPPPAEVPSCMGLALAVDGTNFASVPRIVANDFTLEAWIKTTASLSGVSAFNGRAIFDSDFIGNGLQNDFAATVVNDRLAFGVGNPDTTLQTIAQVTTDEWIHVAFTRQAGNGRLQIVLNGALDAVATAPNRMPLAARPDLAFGGFSATRKFIGAIDEVKIWNVVRSVAEIAASMRSRPDGSEAGLVGYYAFEDPGGSQTIDGSSMGLDATLTGNPDFVLSSALCSPSTTL
jgi:Concanavalin A-like lectin/glucanases superfamily